MRRRAGLLALLLTAIGFASGCSVIPYAPKTDLVTDANFSEIAAQLKSRLTTSPWYKKGELRVTEDTAAMSLTNGLIFNAPYDKVRGIRIYSNYNTFVMGDDGEIISKVLFNSEGDAKDFANLLMSLVQAHRENRIYPSGPPSRPTPAPSPSPGTTPARPDPVTPTPAPPPVTVKAKACPFCGSRSRDPTACERCGIAW